MHNLKHYDGNAFDLYKKAVKRKDDGDSKTRLVAAEADVKAYYEEYDRHFISNTLRAISPRRVNGALYKDLYDMYGFETAIVREVRRGLKKVNPVTVVGICQHCGIVPYDTMDHVLPHKQYAEYSVHAQNLIPCCTDCNRRKNEREILNLYKDILPQEEYLFMDVKADGDTIDVSFRLDNSSRKVETEMFNKITNHYTKLEILSRLKTVALTKITAFVLSIQTLYESQGKDAVVSSVMDGLDVMRKAYGYNYWEVAFQKGLVNSPVFWDYYEKGLLV